MSEYCAGQWLMDNPASSSSGGSYWGPGGATPDGRRCTWCGAGELTPCNCVADREYLDDWTRRVETGEFDVPEDGEGM